MGRRGLELAGRWFGALEVLERAGSTAKGASLWRCICHRCGAECTIEGQRLTDKRNGKKDCGCARREQWRDLTGETFGALHVLRRTGVYKSGDRLYLCRCAICGKEKEFPASAIRQNLQSCGCGRYNSPRMTALSTTACQTKFRLCDNGKKADLVAAHSDKATVASKTGVRGVYRIKQTPGKYRASVRVAGELWIKDGFDTIQAAQKELLAKKAELLEKYGLDQET